MSFFKNIFGNSSSIEEIQKKGMEGIIHYKNNNFQNAVKSFEKYFEMKGDGKYPDLDRDDAIMLINLGNAKQYSSDFLGAIHVYETISKKKPNWDAPYLMKSICQHKIGNIAESKLQWELARRFGNDVAQNPYETGIKQFK